MNTVCSSGIIDLRFGAGDLVGGGGVRTYFKAATGGDGGGQQRAASALCQASSCVAGRGGQYVMKDVGRMECMGVLLQGSWGAVHTVLYDT